MSFLFLLTYPPTCAICPRTCLQTSGATRPLVKKKAALCLLRLMRKTPADGQVRAPSSVRVSSSLKHPSIML